MEPLRELELLVNREIPTTVITNQSSYPIYRKDAHDGRMEIYAYR